MIVRTLPYADLLVRGDEALVLLRDRRGTVPVTSHGEAPSWDVTGTVPVSSRGEELGGTIARLSAIGVSVLELAAGGIDDEELARQLELRFGAPPQRSTKDAVAQVLAALAEQRLVGLE